MNERAWTKILEQSDKKDLLILIQKMADTNDDAESILIEYCKKKVDTHQKEALYERQLQMKWDSIRQIVDDANEYGGCPQAEEDQVYDTLYEMQEIVKEHATAWDARKDIVDEMLEQANYGNSGFLFLSMPLVLGSVFSFLILLLYIPIIRRRIKNEEKVLEQGLQEYLEYEKKVKYKIIPYIW